MKLDILHNGKAPAYPEFQIVRLASSPREYGSCKPKASNIVACNHRWNLDTPKDLPEDLQLQQDVGVVMGFQSFQFLDQQVSNDLRMFMMQNECSQ